MGFQLWRTRAEASRALDDGDELLEARAQAKYASCRWSLALSEGRLRSLTVECSFQRWSTLGVAFREALGTAFEIRENGDRAVARVEYTSILRSSPQAPPNRFRPPIKNPSNDGLSALAHPGRGI